MRVGVVGGGLAGLVAAFYLRKNDPACEVHVFEASESPGGVIHTERVGDFLLEHGADMFATQPPAAMRLCDDLGVTGRLISPQPGGRGAAIVCRGRLVKIPDGFVLMRPTRIASMVTTPLLSPFGKLRLLAEALVKTRQEAGDESIASFVNRRMGGEVLRRIVQPLVGGIYTGDVDRLSMAATMTQFQKMEQEDGSLFAATRRRKREGVDTTERNSAGARYEQFRSFPGGIQELVDSLAAALPPDSIHTRRRVSRLIRVDATVSNGDDAPNHDTAKPPRWRLGGAEELGDFDHVIVATPAAAAAKLLAEPAGEAAGLIAGIEAASSAVVAIGVNESDIARPIDIAGFVVPAIERRPILAGSFTSDKFAGRAPAGQKLIRVFFGGVLQPEMLKQDDESLIRVARSELASLIGLSGTPTLARVIRWNHAMPQYHVGHNERVESIDRALAATPGLHVAGNSYRGVGIAPTVAASAAVAARIQGLNSASQ